MVRGMRERRAVVRKQDSFTSVRMVLTFISYVADSFLRIEPCPVLELEYVGEQRQDGELSGNWT